MQDFIREIIKEAGQIAKEYFEKGVKFETKSHLGDLLTIADTKVSDFLVEKIHEKYPDHHITSEERDEPINPGARYEWVIDPIDGTRNFAKGVPIWCTILAVLEDGEVKFGAVYSPMLDELFFAQAGHGATLNGMPISVNDKSDFEYAVGIVTRMPEEGNIYGQYIDKYKKVCSKIILETKIWFHQYGCMLGWCYVASGGMDLCIQNAGLDHDYLAPILILREAGAVVTDSDGNEWKRGRQDAIVANPKLHKKLLELFY